MGKSLYINGEYIWKATKYASVDIEGIYTFEELQKMLCEMIQSSDFENFSLAASIIDNICSPDDIIKISYG